MAAPLGSCWSREMRAKERSRWPVGGPTWGMLAVWLLAGKGTPGGTSTTLPPVCEGACLHRAALSCKPNSCNRPLALQEETTGETVCIEACRRRSKLGAIAEDVPRALLLYVGCWAQVGQACCVRLAGAERWHPPWPSSPVLALGKLATAYAEVGRISPESWRSWEILSNL